MKLTQKIFNTTPPKTDSIEDWNNFLKQEERFKRSERIRETKQKTPEENPYLETRVRKVGAKYKQASIQSMGEILVEPEQERVLERKQRPKYENKKNKYDRQKRKRQEKQYLRRQKFREEYYANLKKNK